MCVAAEYLVTKQTNESYIIIIIIELEFANYVMNEALQTR